MKKQRKFQRLKNYIYSGRFRTRLILLLVVLPGFIFTPLYNFLKEMPHETL